MTGIWYQIEGAAWRWLARCAAALMIVCAAGGIARAQAPAPGAPGAPGAQPAPAPGAAQAPTAPPGYGIFTGNVHLRVHLPLIDQFSYTVHPFLQITGDASYRDAKAAAGSIFVAGERETDAETGFILKTLHSLPSFGIEGLATIDGFPRGLGFGFDYAAFAQHDTGAVSSGGQISAITMDSYFYSGVLRFYFFDPNEPGVNYFIGFGLGVIDGRIKVPFQNAEPQYVKFSQTPVGSTRFGLESRGDTWGFRYELMVINADDVTLERNPYDADGDGQPGTQISFSGALVRLSLFFQY